MPWHSDDAVTRAHLGVQCSTCGAWLGTIYDVDTSLGPRETQLETLAIRERVGEMVLELHRRSQPVCPGRGSVQHHGIHRISDDSCYRNPPKL